MKQKGFLLNGKSALNHVDASDIFIEIQDELRQQIQNDLLQMYLDLATVCEKYQLTPFFIGGSALGAIRHQGFIPWDDDLDIGMTRDDFEVFKTICEKELGEKYLLSAPNYKGKARNRFPKLIKKNTIFQEVQDREISERTGLFLDIFIIENVPENRIVRWITGIRCNFTEFLAGQVMLYENDSELLKKFYCKVNPMNYYLRMIIGKFFSYKPSWEWFNKIDSIVQCKNKQTRLCGTPTGSKHYFGEIYPKSMVFPVRYEVFEGQRVAVYHACEQYLEHMYGDYRTVPPVEDRQTHFLVNVKL